MEEKDEWVFFRELDFLCPKNNIFSVDTRDFHCGYTFKKEEHPNLATLRKYKSSFIFTREEVVEFLERIYVESGEEKEWRYLELDYNDARVKNWLLKYIRIFRNNDGTFLVCNDEKVALRRDMINSKVLNRQENYCI